MVIKELYMTRKDGVNLYKTYSDGNFKIRQVETGNVYDVAIDVENAPFIYEETEEKIQMEAIKYSTQKIIRTLGDDWQMYKAQMEAAGVLDQFYAANYLKSDDPVFSAFLEKVPNEIKEKLNECIWEEF
jgi:hypothetical protein